MPHIFLKIMPLISLIGFYGVHWQNKIKRMVQSNLSTTAALGTEESGRCGEVGGGGGGGGGGGVNITIF